MENKQPLESLMDTTMDKIRQMVDVNTVIGTPVTSPDGTIIIPVSKVAYGFASGGSSFVAKSSPSKDLFGGGTGAGVTINPIAFIVISNGDAKVVSIDTPNSGVAEKALAMAPDLIDKITALFGKDEKEEADQQQDDIAVDDQPQQESDDNN
ncbi:MAG: GerW family sporulation protein [Ruminococcus sp.]|nr:GerW family sporulation protein [Ruminococcus sp.]MDD6447028.1 GerW family sporulation protein [Ruminococcus sp.]MDY2856475.1 GerW family sporulation protein [Oscillospiraceae bacterium]